MGLTKTTWTKISVNQGLSEHFMRINQDNLEWYYICQYQTLSEGFIKEFQKKVDWASISIHQKLSEKFIEEFKDKIDWLYICKYQVLSEDFIAKHQNKVNWKKISQHQKLSEKFIEKFQEKVDWEKICTHQELSNKFLIYLYKTNQEKEYQRLKIRKEFYRFAIELESEVSNLLLKFYDSISKIISFSSVK